MGAESSAVWGNAGRGCAARAGTREWIIRGNLELDAHNRFADEPKVEVRETGSLLVYGAAPLQLGDVVVENNLVDGKPGRVIDKSGNFVVNGSLTVKSRMDVGRWYFITLPFNVKVGDIAFADGSAKCAIRHYLGDNRALSGTGNNWADFEADDIIPAGTGFIMQTSKDGWWLFPSQDDASKQYMTSNKMFVKLLEANQVEGADDSNVGWNLVGNPYQAWYNIHKINFTAPITVRNTKNNNYEAYSIIDDDYALAPNQAFFVQCPDGTSEISFPVEGRQLTSEITSQNGAPARNAAAAARQLIDLVLSGADGTDRTRVVVNAQASAGYEMACDAGKFMSEAAVPQLYTIGANGTEYAINERPLVRQAFTPSQA